MFKTAGEIIWLYILSEKVNYLIYMETYNIYQ